MRANLQTRTGDLLSLAQYWYLSGIHTDITIRCNSTINKQVFKCHRIIVRELLEKELKIKLLELDHEADELIVPDFYTSHCEEIIRLSYGFEKGYRDKPFSHEVQINPLEIKVKLEDEENQIAEESESAANADFLSSIVNGVQQDPFFVPHPAVPNVPGFPNFIQGVVQGIQGNKVCPYCQKVFKRQDHLTRHLLQHTGERPHQCNLCLKTYTRKDKLKGHYKKNHPGQVFICFCSKFFFSENEFEEHMKANPQHYKDSNENAKDNHMEHNDDEEELDSTEFPEEKRMVIDEGNIEDHDESSGNNNSQANGDPNSNWQNEQSITQNPPTIQLVKKELDEFDMGMSGSSSAVNGQNINHAMKFDEDEKNDPLDVKPNLAGKKRKKRAKKKKETIGEETDEEGEGAPGEKKEYSCQFCSNTFTTLKKRKAHYIGDHFEELKENGLLFTHNNAVRIKKHGCPMDGCDRSFRHLCEVQDHVNVVHKKEKNYVCDLCSKAFPYKKSLRHHMDLKHDVHKNESILCPKCGDIFNSKAKLSTHIASKHKIRVAKFQCKFCDFKTHAKNVITEHERTHTGEKPEICQWCGKGFNAKKTLKNHERLHTGEKPYQCKLCNSSFAQRTSLNVHMNSHHKSDLPADSNKEEKNYTYKHNNFDQPNDQNQNSANMSTNPHQDHQRPLSTNTTNASEVDPNDNLKTEYEPQPLQVSPGGGFNSHQHQQVHNQQHQPQRPSLFLDYRSNAMMPNLEAVNYSEAARNKVAGEATPLLSIKALTN